MCSGTRSSTPATERRHIVQEFHFEGDYIVGMTKSMLPLVGLFKNPTEIRIKVTDDMTVRITDDEQVLDTTIFR